MTMAESAKKFVRKHKVVIISSAVSIVLLIAVLLLIFVPKCGNAESFNLSSVADGMFGRYSATDIKNAQDGTEVSNFIEEYRSVVDSESGRRALEAELVNRINICDEYDSFTAICLAMEALDYKNEAVRNAFDERIKSYYTSDNFIDKSFPQIREEINKGKGIGLEYYHSVETLLSNEDIGKVFENVRTDATESGKFADTMRFAFMVSEFMEEHPQWDTECILPFEELMASVSNDAQTVTVNDSEDGYYDSKREDFQNIDNVDENGNNVSTSYEFFGDFMIETREISFPISDVVEGSEDIGTETEYILYCRGEAVSESVELFREILPTAQKIYLKEGFCVAETTEGIICFAGEVTFRLPYTKA